MFSNPIFLQLATDFFYGVDGIAPSAPTVFQDQLPLPALVIVRFLVSLSVYLFIFVTKCKIIDKAFVD